MGFFFDFLAFVDFKRRNELGKVSQPFDLLGNAGEIFLELRNLREVCFN